jgi:hypothetical protein
MYTISALAIFCIGASPIANEASDESDSLIVGV